MLKKEFTQFVRSKSNVLMMFVFPILLITTLSVGLKDLMNSNIDIFGNDGESSTVYYTVENDKYKEGFLSFQEGVSDTVSIKFEEVKSLDDVREKVDNYDAIAHITATEDGFNYYSSSKGEKTSSEIFRSIFDSVLNEYAVYSTIGEYNPQAFAKLVENKYDEYVSKQGVDDLRNVTSAEYYTFAELALIIFYVAQLVAESVYNENRLTTLNRLRLSSISEGAMLSAKVILGFVIATIQTILVYFYSSMVLDVNWGEHTIKFIVLFLVFGLFSAIVGAVIGLMAKKETSALSNLNVITFVICALGGCYTPMQMVVSMPILNKLMYLSPIYWINTATSTMICGVESNAYLIAIMVPVVLSLICVGVYFVMFKRREKMANV
ncbi:MAG: ABC transporter permease [Clostridium sp.]